MSVYSGFCTRKQERDYNFCIQKMMFVLAKRCVKAIHNIPVDSARFAAYFGKLYLLMTKLESNKYQEPKISESLQQLADVLGIKVQQQNDPQNPSSAPMPSIQNEARIKKSQYRNSSSPMNQQPLIRFNHEQKSELVASVIPQPPNTYFNYSNQKEPPINNKNILNIFNSKQNKNSLNGHTFKDDTFQKRYSLHQETTPQKIPFPLQQIREDQTNQQRMNLSQVKEDSQHRTQYDKFRKFNSFHEPSTKQDNNYHQNPINHQRSIKDRELEFLNLFEDKNPMNDSNGAHALLRNIEEENESVFASNSSPKRIQQKKVFQILMDQKAIMYYQWKDNEQIGLQEEDEFDENTES